MTSLTQWLPAARWQEHCVVHQVVGREVRIERICGQRSRDIAKELESIKLISWVLSKSDNRIEMNRNESA